MRDKTDQKQNQLRTQAIWSHQCCLYTVWEKLTVYEDQEGILIANYTH